jgi:uncharacterized damage-inducible protein DinB
MHAFMLQHLICHNHLTGFTSALPSVAFTAHLIICCSRTASRLKRLTGEGDHPNRLDAILCEDRMELARARIAEDERFITTVEKYDEAALRGLLSYRTSSGMPQSQVLGDILMHLFNHQTHHRGQAHACPINSNRG